MLGVIFKLKLRWENHVTCAINKANRSLNTLNMIRKYFNSKKLLTLTARNFNWILFYNSEIWLSTYLNDNVKHKICVASANALKMCPHSLKLQKFTGRVTPLLTSDYKCALQLFKTFNECLPLEEWVHLVLQVLVLLMV